MTKASLKGGGLHLLHCCFVLLLDDVWTRPNAVTFIHTQSSFLLRMFSQQC